MARVVAILSFALASALAGAGSSGAASAGSTIIFSATSADAQVNQLFSIDTSGDGLKQLTTGSYPSDAPAFSPNGRRVAFERLGVGILTMNPDGSGLHRVTTNPRDSFPAWSPDGRQLAFIRPAKSGWHLWIVPSSGGPARMLKHAPPSGRPSWTKSGLLIPSGGDLLKVDPKTGKVLKFFGATIDAVWGLNTTAVAPNVSILSYVGARAPDPGDMECGEGPCQRFALYIESLLTTKKRPLLLFKDVGPATFSPSGKQLAFVAKGELEIASLGGSVAQTIATGDAYPTIAAPPAWQPR
jgi:Tol biopolymer transport system component